MLVLVALLGTGCTSAPGAGSGAPEPALASRYAQALDALALGRVDAATALFTALATERPDLTGPARQLARIALEQGDAARAAVHLDTALAHCTDCAPVLTERALVDRDQGAFDAARRRYEDALALDPTFAPAHFDLAVLYELYLDEPAAAAQHYGEYLALASEDPEGDRIRAWIGHLERESAATAHGAVAAGGPS